MSATFDQAEFDELVRLISEGGADDPEELAHEVYQLLKPDSPGCWAEDETPTVSEDPEFHDLSGDQPGN